MLYITNSLSLNMIQGRGTVLAIKKISLEKAREIVRKNKFVSAIGHEGTAKVVSKLLKREIKAQRIEVKMKDEDALLAVSLGKRLPEGKVLSEQEIKDYKLEFFIIIVPNHMDDAWEEVKKI